MKRKVICLILLSVLLLPGCNITSDETTPPPVMTGDIPTPKPTEAKPTDPGTGVQPTLPEIAREVNCFVVIHNEPGADAKSTLYAEQYWPALVQLVAAADDDGHRLNLLLNPQWATYILADNTRLALLRAWEANGHEIGLHHHGPHMGAWDGYTDQGDFFNDPEFIGKIKNMMDLMKRLPASGTIRVAGIPDIDADLEYPAGILYDVDGGWNGVIDLVSSPSKISWNNHVMTHLSHARYGKSTVGINVSLEEIEQAIDSVSEGEIIGIVFHSFEYADNPEIFNILFAFLSAQGVQTKTIPEIS